MKTACPEIQKVFRAFQHKFVLVPADKAVNNVIVVCKKYYLEVVLSELNTTSTYEHDDRDCEHVVTEHLRYMTNNNISVEIMLRHFIGCLIT